MQGWPRGGWACRNGDRAFRSAETMTVSAQLRSRGLLDGRGLRKAGKISEAEPYFKIAAGLAPIFMPCSACNNHRTDTD